MLLLVLIRACLYRYKASSANEWACFSTKALYSTSSLPKHTPTALSMALLMFIRQLIVFCWMCPRTHTDPHSQTRRNAHTQIRANTHIHTHSSTVAQWLISKLIGCHALWWTCFLINRLLSVVCLLMFSQADHSPSRSGTKMVITSLVLTPPPPTHLHTHTHHTHTTHTHTKVWDIMRSHYPLLPGVKGTRQSYSSTW